MLQAVFGSYVTPPGVGGALPRPLSLGPGLARGVELRCQPYQWESRWLAPTNLTTLMALLYGQSR